MSVTPTGPVARWDATVAEHKHQQLLRIGRAAVELVAGQGISAATMTALARAVGVSRATLYNYVPDVATAIRRYLAAHTEDFYTAVATAVAEETGAEAQLRRYISEQVAYAAGHDHRVAAALAAIGAAVPEADSATAHGKRHPEILERILDDGVQTGIFRAAPAGVHATLIIRLLYSTPTLIDDLHLSQAETTSAITDLIFHGISPAEPRTPTQRTPAPRSTAR